MITHKEQTEIIVGLTATIVILLLWAWNHGQTSIIQTTQAAPQPQPPGQPDTHNHTSANYAVGPYDPMGNIPNSVNLGDVNLNFPVNVNNTTLSISSPGLSGLSFPPITQLAAVNNSSGTPQCGCTPSDVNSFDSLNNSLAALYGATLTALRNLGSVQASPEVTIILNQARPPPAPASYVHFTREIYTVNGIDTTTQSVAYDPTLAAGAGSLNYAVAQAKAASVGSNVSLTWSTSNSP